jgi:hypothetical protein
MIKARKDPVIGLPQGITYPLPEKGSLFITGNTQGRWNDRIAGISPRTPCERESA